MPPPSALIPFPFQSKLLFPALPAVRYPSFSFFSSGRDAAYLHEMPPISDNESIVYPHPIPNLPIFNGLTHQLLTLRRPEFSKIVGVFSQQNLETTSNVYRFAIQMGLIAFGRGKQYSSSPPVQKTITNLGVHLMPDPISPRPGYYREASNEVEKKLWGHAVKYAKDNGMRMFAILADGGGLFEAMPSHLALDYRVIGAEQTRGGLYSPALNNMLFPVVSIASSAAKREIESPLIAKAIEEKIMAYLPTLNISKDSVCGIIGNGAVGFALAKRLVQEGYKVIIYDENQKSFDGMKVDGAYRASSKEEVMFNADYIFGCTGQDIMTDNPDIISQFTRDKTFISCSSEDREFRSALRKIPAPKNYNPLADVVHTNEQGAKITFKYGGFPFNFAPFPQIDPATGMQIIPKYPDPSNVPAEDIELTQSLLALGLTQSLLTAHTLVRDGHTVNGSQLHCLNPFGQRAIVTRWLQLRGRGRFPEELSKKFQDIDWIVEHSGGKYVPNKQLEDCIARLPVRYDEPSSIEGLKESSTSSVKTP